MNASIPYLIFTGNCREVLNFYKTVFSGEITLLQTLGESPIPHDPAAAHYIFNGEMKAGDLVIKASDNLPQNKTIAGNNFSLFLAIDEPEAQARIFGELAEGGEVMFPLEHGFGMLRDRYGIQWMLAGKIS